MLNFLNAFRSLKRNRSVYAFFSLTVFMFFIPDCIEALIISKTLSQPPIWMFVAVRSAGISAAALFFLLGILYASKAVSSEGRPSASFSIITSIPSAVYSILGFVLFMLFIKFSYPGLAEISPAGFLQFDLLLILKALSLILLIFVLPFLLLGSILSFDKEISFLNMYGGLHFALRYFAWKPLSLVLSFVISLLAFLAIHFLRLPLINYIEDLHLSAIAGMFLNSAVLACAAGFIISAFCGAYFCFVSSYLREPAAHASGNTAIPSLILIVVIAASIPLLNIPAASNLSQELMKAVDAEFTAAKGYVDKEELDLASFHYRRSYDLSDAIGSYFKLLMKEKDSSYSEAEKSKQRSETETVFRRVGQNDPDNGLFNYLDSLRLKQLKADDRRIKSLEYSAKLLPGFPNISYELLDYYKSKKNDELQKTTLENLLHNRNYLAFTSLDTLSQKDLQKMIDQLNEKAKACYEKFPILAYYYYDNKMYEEALAELKVLSKQMPDDLTVNYLIAMVDLELMQDNKRYEDALKAVDNILKIYPNENWALDLKSQVATKAGNKDVVEKNAEQMYAKDPSNLDIAEQYAYSLMSKNTSFTMDDSDKKAEAVLSKILQQSKDRWFAYYCQAVLDLKKSEFEKSLNNFISFAWIIRPQSDLFATYDDFYYLYALKFKNFITKPEAKKALDALKTRELLAYNYLYGTYYWSVKDAPNGKKFLGDAVSIAPELSKAHVLLGNVFFENAYLKKAPEDYPTAITEYKRALSIFEADPYTWFTLAHVYKKLERYEEALGAFQKSVYFMPAEDHNFDHFGVSIHSRLQIEEIKKKLGQN